MEPGVRFEKYRYEHRPHRHSGENLVLAYILSTVGAAILIGLALLVAFDTGWMTRIQSATKTIEARLPDLPRADVGGVLENITGNMKSVGDLSAGGLQRQGEQVRALNGPLKPHSAKK